MAARGRRKNVVQKRPAETGGVAFALAAIVARLLGVDDPDTITYMAIVAGAVPAAITWLVGLRA